MSFCYAACIKEVLHEVFGDLSAAPETDRLSTRAVLAPKNDQVDAVNAFATDVFPGVAIVFLPQTRPLAKIFLLRFLLSFSTPVRNFTV